MVIMKSLSLAALPTGNVLVIAPHPDDESLGCGGLLSMLAAAGRSLHIVFVTDGGASHPHSRTWSRSRLALQREQEAAEALCSPRPRQSSADIPAAARCEHAGADVVHEKRRTGKAMPDS